jgi:hypothetical protein
MEKTKGCLSDNLPMDWRMKPLVLSLVEEIPDCALPMHCSHGCHAEIGKNHSCFRVKSQVRYP